MNRDMTIEEQRSWWDEAAKENAAYSVLSNQENWQLDDFYATGRDWARQHVDFARAAAIELKGETALDFGCGLGRMTLALTDYYECTTGVDISPEMIRQAGENVSSARVEFLSIDGTELPFSTGLYDLVYSTIVIQHISPPFNREVVAELFRVARPGGIVLFDAPARMQPQQPAGDGIYILPFGEIMKQAGDRAVLMALRNFPATNTLHYQYLFQMID